MNLQCPMTFTGGLNLTFSKLLNAYGQQLKLSLDFSVLLSNKEGNGKIHKSCCVHKWTDIFLVEIEIVFKQSFFIALFSFWHQEIETTHRNGSKQCLRLQTSWDGATELGGSPNVISRLWGAESQKVEVIEVHTHWNVFRIQGSNTRSLWEKSKYRNFK